MILDTTILIDILRSYAPALATIADLEKRLVPLRTTAISVFELFQDMQQLSQEKQNHIKELLHSLHIVPLEGEAAEQAGILRAQLQQEGQSIDPEDSMIAGIAKLHHETLLTRNTKHFASIQELQLATY